MKMKKSVIATAMVATFAVLSSCRKELSTVKNPDTTITKSGVTSLQNNLPETLAPLVSSIGKSVSNNVAGFYAGLPARYDSTSKSYPLIVFIHGVGELATANKDLSAVSHLGITALLTSHKFPPSFTVNGNTFSFIIASPQFKEWPKTTDVNSFIDYIVKNYRVDASRIYVSGLSMGGGTTWDFASDFGKRVAAIVPISGAGWAADNKASAIAKEHVAVWAFHNSGDKVVSASISEQFVQKINANSGSAKLTLFNSNDHDAWTKATDPNYRENGMNIYEWMLQYSKTAH